MPIGVALLKEGIFPLLSFLHKIEHQRCIAGKFHQSALSVELGVESAFYHANSHGAALEDRFAPLNSFIFKLLERHNFVDHAHALGLVGGVLPAKEPNFASLFLPNATRQIRRAETGIETAHLRACLSESGILGGYGKVANELQHIAAANGIAVDHCYYRLGE